jgi:hypothetical protein
MGLDQETEAISKVAEALSGLDSEAVGRVIQWAAARYKVTVSARKENLSDKTSTGGHHPAEQTATFESFADFYTEVAPTNENDKVLVAAYWKQQMQGEAAWASQDVNELLKDLGHNISNITRTLGNLQSAKPTLAIQTSKSGKGKQARKQYKLTNEGLKRVKKLLAKEIEAES